MLIYTKLWLLLEKRGMKRTDLKEIMSSATLAKLGKNEPVSSTVIAKICDFLNCQPNDIMEHVTKEKIEKITKDRQKKYRSLYAYENRMEMLLKELEKAVQAMKKIDKQS